MRTTVLSCIVAASLVMGGAPSAYADEPAPAPVTAAPDIVWDGQGSPGESAAVASSGTEVASSFLVPVAKKTEVPDGFIGIYTKQDLEEVRDDLEADYILMEDIDLAGGQWEPLAGRIDDTGAALHTFSGTFDGNGHVISNLNPKADLDDSASAGLFGALYKAKVANLGLRNVVFAGSFTMPESNTYTGGVTFGAIAAQGNSSKIENCWASVSVSMEVRERSMDGEGTHAGGIIGEGRGTTVTACSVAGTMQVSVINDADIGSVDAMSFVGGIGGVVSAVDRCVSSCALVSNVAVEATYDPAWRDDAAWATAYVGGIAGMGRETTQCANFGPIDSTVFCGNQSGMGIVSHFAGGILGESNADSLTKPLDSFNASTVRATTVANKISSFAAVGGLVGIGGDTSEGTSYFRGYTAADVSSTLEGSGTHDHFTSPIVGQSNSVWGGDVFVAEARNSYYLDSALVQGGERGDRSTPLSSSAMQQQASFAGWDFENVWAMGEGEYRYPVLRALSGGVPEEPDGPGHLATDPLVQLVACELAAFNPGSSWVGKTVEDFVASEAFRAKDRAVWSNADVRYSDVLTSVLGGYTFVSAVGEGPNKHVAVRDPSTGGIVLALDPKGIITYAESFNSLAQGEAQGCFDAAVQVCQEVRAANPTAPIHVTGGFLGGMAAAYVSNTSGSPAHVFNASAGYGAKLSWLTQGEFVDGNAFKGIDSPLCTNYYASSMSLLYGYGSDVLASAKVYANPNGSKYRLNALYEATDDGFALRDSVTSTPEAKAKTFYMADVSAVLKSVTNSVNNLSSGKPDLSFASKNIQLTLGTTGKDVKMTGMDDALGPYNLCLPQIVYTGAGDGDNMRGSQTADIFVAGPGSSRFAGNEGSDLYVIGDDADVRISDTCATDGNVLCNGLMGVMKAVVFTNLAQPNAAKEGLEDVLKSTIEILMDSRQDTIVFRGCSFEDMEVTLVDASFPHSDYYEIKAGSSTVQVQKRFFLKRDFLVVDASAKGAGAREARGKNLEELYKEKNGLSGRGAANIAEAYGEEDAAHAVTAHFQGAGIALSVRDAVSGDELFAFGTDESLDYCDTYGTFSSCAETGSVDVAYDASQVSVALTKGDPARIVTNAEAGIVGGAISFADGQAFSGYDEIEVRSEGTVRLVGQAVDGGEQAIETTTVSKDDIDASTSTEAKDIAAATISDISEQPWTGSPVAPSVAVAFEGASLEEGIDYDLSHESNEGPGWANAVIKGKGLFTGEARAPFFIYDATDPDPGPGPDPDPDPEPASVKRVGGTDRYKTMALVSQQAFPDQGSCPTVVVARGDNFPDALSAAGLAGVTGGQVLLTQTEVLTAETRAEIERLGATRAYVIGDVNSVTTRTFNEIKSLVGGSATRLGGADRMDTALKIYGAGNGGWGTTAIVATGAKAADALSASPVAYALKAPIFLADGAGNLSSASLDAIANGGFDTVLVMGSPYSVSASTETSLKRYAATVRFSGDSRYETSQLMAQWAFDNGFSCKYAVATAGREGKYADALVASSLGGRSASPVLLVDDGADGRVCISQVLASCKDQVETVYVIGDQYSVSNAAYSAIERVLS